MFFVYALKNEQGRIYIGQTDNLELRLEKHNSKVNNYKKSYTYKMGGEWVVAYKELFMTRAEAMKREKELKSFKGREFIKNLIK